MEATMEDEGLRRVNGQMASDISESGLSVAKSDYLLDSMVVWIEYIFPAAGSGSGARLPDEFFEPLATSTPSETAL